MRRHSINQQHPLATGAGEGLALRVIVVMSEVYGILPSAFWGLSRSVDLMTTRGYVIDSEHSYNTYCLKILPEYQRYEIGSLKTAQDFNRSLTILQGIKRIYFGRSFNRPVILPWGLEELEFDKLGVFNNPIQLVEGLRNLALGHSFSQPLELPESLRDLVLGYSYSHPVKLPSRLRSLTVGYHFPEGVILPQSVEVLKWQCPHPPVFPVSLKHVEFGLFFCLRVDLPSTLETVTFHGYYNHRLRLPSGLKSITFLRPYTLPLTLPEGCVRKGDPYRCTVVSSVSANDA